jgi:hypothetical protein
LLVGLNRYVRGGWPELPFSRNDLSNVIVGLSTIGFLPENIYVVTDVPRAELPANLDFRYEAWSERYDLSDLAAKMDEVVGQARTSDTVFFYFSGHGAAQRDLRFFATPKSTDLPLSFLPMPQVVNMLLPGSTEFHGILVVDACATDNVLKLRAPIQAVPRGSVFELYSSQLGAPSCWDDGLRGSVFTHYLVKALHEVRGADGRIGARALAEYVKQTVPKHAPHPSCFKRDPFSRRQVRTQTPSVSESRDFAVGTAP